MKNIFFALVLSHSLFYLPIAQAAAPITTVAGSGAASLTGDSSSALSAGLNFPSDVIKDSNNTLYIADTDNHVIRRIDALTGIISTVAGNGAAGFSGDGGSAINANLNQPSGLAVDGNDTLYIADSGNNRIRHLDASGNISTVVGNGALQLNAPHGLAFDASSNSLYIADSGNGRILKRDAAGNTTLFAGTGAQGFSGDNGPAINASLNAPYYLALDSNNKVLYVSGYFSQRIRKIALTGSNTVTTVAGNGDTGFGADNVVATSTSLNNPQGLAVDSRGNLYIADHLNHRLRMVDGNGIISTISGTGTAGFSGDNGAAALAEINHPIGLFFDNNDNLLFADAFNHRIRSVLIDLTPPALTLLGTTPLTVEAALTYSDAGASALDAVDGDISAQIVTLNPVQSTVPGNYTLTYDVSDAAGNAAPQISRAVTIVDTTSPDLVLNSRNPLQVEAGTPYNDAGATAQDIVDGDLSANIVTTGVAAVDTAVLGSYNVDYSVTDTAGNNATQTRIVNVTDTTPPVLTLKGSNTLTLDLGKPYSEQGATALDSFDGDLTASLTHSGQVDTNTPGSYKISYLSIDSSGNQTTKTRTITVIDHLILRSTTRGEGGGALGLNLLFVLMALVLLQRRKQLSLQQQEAI